MSSDMWLCECYLCLAVVAYDKYTCCLIYLGYTSRKVHISALTDTYPLTIKEKVKEGSTYLSGMRICCFTVLANDSTVNCH